MEIGSKIAKLRKEKGLSQKELAQHLLVTDKAVSRWESGAGNPELETIPLIADFFGVSTDYLIRDDCEDPKPQKAPSRAHKKHIIGTVLFSVALGLLVTALTAFAIFLIVDISNFYIAASKDGAQGATFLGPEGTYRLYRFEYSEVNDLVIQFAAAQGRTGLTVNDADFIQWKNSLLAVYELRGTTYWAKGYPIFSATWIALCAITLAHLIPCLIFQIRFSKKVVRDNHPTPSKTTVA